MGGGGNEFWNFRRLGGVKTWKPSVVGYGYFLELPNESGESFANPCFQQFLGCHNVTSTQGGFVSSGFSENKGL